MHLSTFHPCSLSDFGLPAFEYRGLLAFEFAAPWLLWSGLLAGIPIVVHLLHKRRYRETTWAAMRFLIEATRKHSRRMRLEQLILLAVRVLIFLLLSAALAQPVMESLATGSRHDAPVHRIIVLDASYSLGARDADGSRFERARGLARAIVDDSRQGDALNLIRLADSLPRTIVREPSFQHGPVAAELDRLQLSDEKGDLLGTIPDILECLNKASAVARKEVYLISDLQRTTWSPETTGMQSLLRKRMEELSKEARIVLLDCGAGDVSNCAATRLSVAEAFVSVDAAVHFEAVVQNFDVNLAQTRSVELFVDGRLAESKTVEIPPRAEARVDFTYTFRNSGDHPVEVRLSPDSLEVDDRRYLIVPVADELNVLLVNGRQSGRKEQTATFYLEKVLSPATGGQPWTGFTRPFVIGEGELASADLTRYDCLFLCNIGLLTDREADILKAYLDSGGAVVFVLGDRVQPENYNRLLGRDGRNILPAVIGDRIGNPLKPESGFEFDVQDLTHPIVRQFAGNPGTGLETTLTLAYFQVTPHADDARVPLRFLNGDPAIVEADRGHGRCLLFATALDATWGAWPVQRSFPPIVHESILFSVAGQGVERQKQVGSIIVRQFPARAFSMPVSLKAPGAAEISLPLAESADFASVTVPETRVSGVYELKLGIPLNRTELFAVNVDPAESDLRKVDERELRNEILTEVPFDFRQRWEQSHSRTEDSRAAAGSLARLLLLIVLALVLSELFMAWKFKAGLAALAVFAGVGAVVQLWTAFPVLGRGLFLLGLMAAGVLLWRLTHTEDTSAA